MNDTDVQVHLWPALGPLIASRTRNRRLQDAVVVPERIRLGPPRLTVPRAGLCWWVHPRNQELVAGVVMASRLVRANAVTVNDVLDGRKLLEIDCADRVYLTLSVLSLVVGGQVVNFLTEHERNLIPSPALLERRGQAFRRAVYSFAEANDIPVVNFAGKRQKGRPGVLADSPWPERKIDQVMPLMRKAAATGHADASPGTG